MDGSTRHGNELENCKTTFTIDAVKRSCAGKGLKVLKVCQSKTMKDNVAREGKRNLDKVSKIFEGGGRN